MRVGVPLAVVLGFAIVAIAVQLGRDGADARAISAPASSAMTVIGMEAPALRLAAFDASKQTPLFGAVAGQGVEDIDLLFAEQRAGPVTVVEEGCWRATWRPNPFGDAIYDLERTCEPEVIVAEYQGRVTHYGTSYEGKLMGCAPRQAYRSSDMSIVAVGPMHYREWPCGTRMRVSGPSGSIVVTRTDACPGCGRYHLDLSEAGIMATCGQLGRCPVTIEVLQ